MKNFSKIEVAWWPLDKRGKLYSSKARAWWHINYLQKNFNDLVITPYGEKGDVLILQKPVLLSVYQKVEPILKNFKIVIFDISDVIANLNEEEALQKGFLSFEQFKKFSQKANFFVVNGIGLQEWVENNFQKQVFIIEDPYHIKYNPKIIKKHKEVKSPKVVWHGGGKLAALFIDGYLKGKSKELLDKYGNYESYLGDLNELLKTRITAFADLSYFKYKKSRKTIFRLHPQYPRLFKKLIKYDIGIAPYWLWDGDCLCKSTNKIDAMMLVGLPIIATPIPENKRLIINGVNGFLCETKKEWGEAFLKLQSRDLREKIGTAGRETVIEKRSIPFLSNQWRKLFIQYAKPI